MKYSITVLQAEVKRFENAIKAAYTNIKYLKTCNKSKEFIKKATQSHTNSIVIHEKSIKELKADIKKL